MYFNITLRRKTLLFVHLNKHIIFKAYNLHINLPSHIQKYIIYFYTVTFEYSPFKHPLQHNAEKENPDLFYIYEFMNFLISIDIHLQIHNPPSRNRNNGHRPSLPT